MKQTPRSVQVLCLDSGGGMLAVRHSSYVFASRQPSHWGPAGECSRAGSRKAGRRKARRSAVPIRHISRPLATRGSIKRISYRTTVPSTTTSRRSQIGGRKRLYPAIIFTRSALLAVWCLNEALRQTLRGLCWVFAVWQHSQRRSTLSNKATVRQTGLWVKTHFLVFLFPLSSFFFMSQTMTAADIGPHDLCMKTCSHKDHH